MNNIIRNVTKDSPFWGCDFVLQTDRERTEPIRLLQITDMQVIDASQRRTPDRLREDEIRAWAPENFESQCGDHIRSLIAQASPDLIFITGDIIYGSFDDKGSSMEWFCRLMDSFGIPWAPVFGNHDNESARGVAWQCEQFRKSEYCLFCRGEVSGNGNYTVGIAVGETLVRVLHMVDSNGCRESREPEVITKAGIYPDQCALIEENTRRIRASQGCDVPAFIAFHIPVEEFQNAEIAKGYAADATSSYVIGCSTPALDRDFGSKNEKYRPIHTEYPFTDFLHRNGINGVFVGHCHAINTCITYDGIRWVFGLKTGQYDYHNFYQTGGTLIRLENNDFSVQHLPSLAAYAPFPGGASMFRNIFA